VARGREALSERPNLENEIREVLRPLVVDVVREELNELVDEHLRERKRWLTLGEAAERLGCSPDAVRMRVRRGRLRVRHQGRRVYVSAQDVDGIA
jgi:excisionase family DNA binding protein